MLGLLSTARIGQASPSENCHLAAEASRRFAYDLYYTIQGREDNSESGNIFLAPTTVTTSLTMLHAGADGHTRQQIWRGLKTSGTTQRLSEDASQCFYQVNNPAPATSDHAVIDPKDDDIVFQTASRLFGEKTFRFKRSFINLTREMGQKIKRLSFSTQPDESRNRINHWVSKMTNDKIQRLFGRNDITSTTILAIVSAVYFKAPWVEPFDSTDPAVFTTSDNRRVTAKYMSNSGNYKWVLSEDLKAELLELPFKSDSEGLISASMIILRPTGTMAELESRLTEQTTDKAVSSLLQTHKQYFRVVMPKFEMSLSYDLKPVLRDMGMDDMFNEGQADFSRMARSSNGLYVSAAVHKTYIKVDEIGVEAAGATGVSISWRTIPRDFEVNRAFIALIYNKVTKTVLFIGKINDPTATH